MKRLKLLVLGIFFSITFFADFVFARETLRLATTTSIYETGLLDHIFPRFEKKYNVQIHIISTGTGKAIKLGENGDVDVILVHDRDSEDKFINDGFGINRRDVMSNDFVILGPQEDPAKIISLTDAKEALRRICNSKQMFISRGDGSGTHKKEKNLWVKAGIFPDSSQYLETGLGMNAALRVADEKNAYVIADEATYLFNQDKIRLKKLVAGDKDLFNPYSIIAVSPYRHSYVKYELAMALIAWITSPQCQEMIKNYKKERHQLFQPNAY